MGKIAEEFEKAVHAMDVSDTDDWQNGARVNRLLRVALRTLAAARKAIPSDDAQGAWATVANIVDQVRRSKVGDAVLLARVATEAKTFEKLTAPKQPARPMTDARISRGLDGGSAAEVRRVRETVGDALSVYDGADFDDPAVVDELLHAVAAELARRGNPTSRERIVRIAAIAFPHENFSLVKPTRRARKSKSTLPGLTPTPKKAPARKPKRAKTPKR